LIPIQLDINPQKNPSNFLKKKINPLIFNLALAEVDLIADIAEAVEEPLLVVMPLILKEMKLRINKMHLISIEEEEEVEEEEDVISTMLQSQTKDKEMLNNLQSIKDKMAKLVKKTKIKRLTEEEEAPEAIDEVASVVDMKTKVHLALTEEEEAADADLEGVDEVDIKTKTHLMTIINSKFPRLPRTQTHLLSEHF